MVGKIKKWLNFFDFNKINLLAGNVAFYLFLSTVPIITLIGIIASWFSLSVDMLVQIFNESLPSEISVILIPFIAGDGIDTSLIIFMIIGFLTASNGPHSIIVAANQLYGETSFNFVKDRIKAILMTIMLVLLFIFMLISLAFGEFLIKFIFEFLFSNTVNDGLIFTYSLIKWPIAFVLIFFAVKIFYLIIPNRKVKSKTVNYGSLFTTTGWIILTLFYSYYVNNIANYDIFYGSLSSIISLMLWTFMVSVILLIGVVINVYFYDLEKNTSTKDK